MKKWLFLIFISNLVYAEDRHVVYIEKRGFEVREISTRTGSFPDPLKSSTPWYLAGFTPLEESVPFVLENFPALTLKRKFEPAKDPNVYREHLVLKAKEEIIPLFEEETRMNQLLQPFGIQEISLEGDGNVLLDATTKKVVAEEFVLSGDVVKKKGNEHWQIEWAMASEEK